MFQKNPLCDSCKRRQESQASWCKTAPQWESGRPTSLPPFYLNAFEMKVYLFRCNGGPRRVRLSNQRQNRQQSSGGCCFRGVLSPDPGKWWGQMPEQKPQSESLSGARIQSSEGPRVGHREAFCKTHLLSSPSRLHVGMIFLFFPFFFEPQITERDQRAWTFRRIGAFLSLPARQAAEKVTAAAALPLGGGPHFGQLACIPWMFPLTASLCSCYNNITQLWPLFGGSS